MGSRGKEVQVGVLGGWTDVGVLGGGWTRENGGGRVRGGWIDECWGLSACVCPARSRRSASQATGTHGWLPKKTGSPGLRRGGIGGYNSHSVPPDSPPDCGTPTTNRLYTFGASKKIISFIKRDGLYNTL